uniref:ribosomal protein L29 n=1 Tax=Vacuolaria virescens TaxID=44451 RepID=UPI002113C01A|nr:ribosomal protein L29 [Vacuolaria virescens]UTE94634.1 ribosomal protein L29 [Vacuolaria virescens]
MSLIKIKKIRDLDLKTIQDEILSLKKELFELKIKKGVRQPFKPHLFKQKRHLLNQLIFIQYEKSLKK